MSAGAMAAALAAVRSRVARAALSAGRDPTSVALVAVSKTRPPEVVRAAYGLGLRDFGENYVQELLAKRDALADLTDLRWHLIGHLQRNKARLVAGAVASVQSIDTPRCAIELGQRVAALGRSVDVMAQVNVGGEEQKSGCAPAELGALLDALESSPALRLRGLMTVPPHTDDPEGARPYFTALARLRDAHGGAGRLPELSMGMTHDLEVAISCGATVVRVGTALFGERGP